MPQFTPAQVQATVSQYTGIGLDTVFDQASAILGESILVCPTYTLLGALKGSARKGLFAIPPAFHGTDVPYYFPENNLSGIAPYNNSAFDASFAGAFTCVVKSGNPNVHPVPAIITPPWPEWTTGNPIEMLFNRTEDFEPNIRTISTDPKLLTRCEFWKNIAPSIPQ